MNRTVAGVIVVVVLAVGIALGVGAGLLNGSSGPTPAPVAVGSTSSPAPTSSQPGSSDEPSDGPSESPGDSPSTEPSASPSPTPVPTPVTVPAPLTGMPVTPALAARRIVVTMVDDQFDARPQSGLSQADVVWQAPAEGGIPRYMAFFQTGDPPAVGPVRSSRLYFIAWASEWKPLYVHAGGSPQAKALLASSKGRGPYVFNADALRWEGRALWRIHTRSAPHNLYTDGKHLRALARKVGAKPVPGQKPAWTFADAAPIEQRPQGGTIVVPYLENRIIYKYNRDSNRYLRSVTGEKKQTDAGTKDRIAPTNVIIMAVHFGPLNDGSNHHRLEATGHGQRQGLDLDQRQDDPRHLAEEEVQRQDAVLRQERQPGHADPRPDVRPGGPGGHERHDPGRQGAGRRDRRSSGRAACTGPSARSPAPARRRRIGAVEIGAGRATSAHAARVSRATSAHVRDRAGRASAASTRPACSSSSVHTARIAVARRPASPGSTRMPAAPTTSGSAPTALATTGTPAASASSAAIPDDSERTGWTSIRAPATSAASRSSGRRGAYAIASARPGARRRARHRRAVPGRGADEADAGRPEGVARRRPGSAPRRVPRGRRTASGRSWRAS